MPRKMRVEYPWSSFGLNLAARERGEPGPPAKERPLAVRLRRETTLTIKDSTARVHLGTYNTANARLHRATKEGFASCNRAKTTMGK